jgi:hypothetical protein
MLLGDGARLFEDAAASRPGKLELTRAVQSPTGVMHLKYTVGGR